MKRQFNQFYFTVLFLTFIIFSCTPKAEQLPVIGVSKGITKDDFGYYGKWLRSADSAIILVDLYSLPIDSALIVLENCSGLLLSGGRDIYPEFYNKIEDTIKCDSYDHKRDTLEIALIKKANNLKMPILGVCRGLQMLNVAFGGTLYADIPTDLGTSVIHRCKGTYDCFHVVFVPANSKLHQISKVKVGVTNSNHHQGIKRLANELDASAHTEDGLIVAIQRRDTSNKAFLFAIQWHPERMDYWNKLSLPIASHFIEEVKKYKSE